MGKIDRGRFTVSAIIILTSSLITRTLSFGFVMLSVYIKVAEYILDPNVIKILNIPEIFGGRSLGSTVQSIVFSLVAVFVLEFAAGIFGVFGAVVKRKHFLVMSVLMSSLMIVVYTVYIVLISMIYHKTDDITSILYHYASVYSHPPYELSYEYYHHVFPGFLSKLGCSISYPNYLTCGNAYKDQVRTYLQTYFGIAITCLLCHVVSIIAVEFTYRKLEFKETHSQLSSNKYYLLLSIRYGIARSFVRCICNNWRKSKLKVFLVSLKLSSLVVYIGLLGMGLTLCGDEFITDGSLRHIFYQLRFYQYTFYDILIGLAASSVVLGFIGAVVSVFYLLGSWKRSKLLLIVGLLSSTIMVILKILIIVLWAVFIDEINDEMRPQLRIQQKGYYLNNNMNRITLSWNNMLMTLQCCGVDNYDDTFYTSNSGRWFCCRNAHESRITPNWNYGNTNSYLTYFGSCGGYKSDTCSGKILFKTRMYIGWFLAIVLLQIVIEMASVLLGNIEYFISHCESDGALKQKNVSGIYYQLTVVFRVTCLRIKDFMLLHCARSKAKVVYFVSMGLIMICCVCTLSIGISIRYDTVFGNGDIKELLKRIGITDTNLTTAIENFSTVVTTFSVANICVVIYSICILVPAKQTTALVIAGLMFWTIMAFSHIVEIGLWSQFIKELNYSVTYQLAIDINSYAYSQQSEYHHPFSFYWNTLFVKGKCCGVSNTGSSFAGTPWYISNPGLIPVQCCTSQTEVYPYDSSYDDSCIHSRQSSHTQGCDTVVEERLKTNFSIPFFVFISITLVAEILCIVTIVMGLRGKVSGELINDSDETKNKDSIESQRKKEPATNSGVKSNENIKHTSESDEKDKLNTSKRSKDKKTKKHRLKPKTKQEDKVALNEGTEESYDLSERRQSSPMTGSETTDIFKDVMTNNETIITNIENETDNNKDQNAAEKQQTTTNETETKSDNYKRESDDTDDNKNRHASDESTEQKHLKL